MKLGFFASAGLVLLAGSIANAATYYVDPSGNDGNAGTSSAPFRTVNKGVTAAGPGDTVILNNGTYGNEGHISDGTGGWYGYAAPVTISKGGTSSAYITVKAANPGQAILDCGTTGSSLGCDKYIVLNAGANYWTFQGLVFTRGAFGGIDTTGGASYINVLNCTFANIGNWIDTTSVGEDGIGFDQTATNWYINGNTFHDIGRTGGLSYLDLDHGIYAKGSNITITNNIFYNLNKGWSIQVANGATNWTIANNTFAFPSISTGQIMLWDSITNISIQNNIFYNPSGYGIERYQASLYTCTVDHNLVYGASSVMGDSTGCTVSNSNIGGNPNFVNPGGYNFQTQAGGAGVDAGVNLSAVPKDFMSMNRPQGASTDIGAYEFASGGSGPNISGVFVNGITNSSASVSWTTDQASNSSVQYGLSNSYGSSSAVNSSLVTSHTVSLSGLQTSTTYHYRVVSTNSTGQTSYSPDATFTTGGTSGGFSFSMSGATSSLSVNQGQSTSTSITATLQSGSAAQVAFSAAGLPAGATASFSSSSCAPTCSTQLTLNTGSLTPPGTYVITIVGTSTTTASTSINLTVHSGKGRYH